MTRPNIAQFRFVCFLCALILAAGAAAQELPTLLTVDLDNFVIYNDDVTEFSKVAQTPTPVAPTPQANFRKSIALADVTAVNGRPAMGVAVQAMQNVFLSRTPAPGGAIADTTRNQTAFFWFEFLAPDGNSIGTINTTSLGGGTPPPGAFPGSISGSGSIISGTGAFVGARGTVNTLVTITPIRGASQAEDPSMRRVNGGGKIRMGFQIWTMFRPEIVVTPGGPAVFHSDFRPVNPERPAQRGETLIVYAKGLGPTRPGVNPGDPFPEQPFAVATSPVEVLVGEKTAPALNQIGVPRTTDTYRVDFQMPSDVAPGMVPIQISAAWVKGAAVPIPVR